MTPPGLSVQESVVAAGAVSPTAKQRGTAPSTVPSKAVPAYENEFVLAIEVSDATVVAAVHAEQPVNAVVTAPAGQLEKKPDSASVEDAVVASAWMVKEIAV